MVIYNETFESHREEVDKINKAIRLLLKHKYKIIDLQNQLIHSGNFERKNCRVAEHNTVYTNK